MPMIGMPRIDLLISKVHSQMAGLARIIDHPSAGKGRWFIDINLNWPADFFLLDRVRHAFETIHAARSTADDRNPKGSFDDGFRRRDRGIVCF